MPFFLFQSQFSMFKVLNGLAFKIFYLTVLMTTNNQQPTINHSNDNMQHLIMWPSQRATRQKRERERENDNATLPFSPLHSATQHTTQKTWSMCIVYCIVCTYVHESIKIVSDIINYQCYLFYSLLHWLFSIMIVN